MFEKKNFVVNCDICDARKVQEESLNGYEKIMINADILVTDERSRAVLNQLPVITNVDTLVDAAPDVRVVIQNGDYDMKAGKISQEKMLLCINGNLLIRPGTGELLESYERIQVNGTVLYPNSLQAYMGKVKINGAASGYPDECIVLNQTYRADLYFPLRAKEGGSYYAEDKMIFADADIDVKRMREKNLKLYTKTCVVREELTEDVLGLLEENVDFRVIPAGYAYVSGDAVLDKELLYRYGTKLYVDGNLTLGHKSESALEALEELEVTGELMLSGKQMELLQKKKVKYQALRIIKGRLLEKKPMVTVSRAMVEDCTEGLHIMRCAYVKLKEDITAEQILDRLTIEQCAKVQCTSQQKDAATLVSSEVGLIGDEEESEGGTSIAGMLSGLWNSKVINADYHIL